MPTADDTPAATRLDDLPSDRVGPADVLGVPRLPPARIGRIGNRARAGLARIHRGAAPPPGQVMEAVLGVLDLAALAALCRLDVPERLTDPASPAELAAASGVDEDRFTRLIRYAATRGWVRIDRQGLVRATRLTSFLRRDHPGGWRAWIEFAAGAEITAALSRLDAGLTPDGDAFAAANGAPFFDWMRDRPDRHAVFDAAMSAGGRMHGVVLARSLDWSTSRRVCDIGGGDGALLGVLLHHHRHLEGVLLELPEVAARAPRRPRVTNVAGDAFTAVPSGCDTYLLVNVVHDWDDEAVVTLLRGVRHALTTAGPPVSPGRLLVVEAEAHRRPRDDLAVRADLLMLALTPGGRERDVAEITHLAEEAGLRTTRVLRLATGDVAYELTAPVN